VHYGLGYFPGHLGLHVCALEQVLAAEALRGNLLVLLGGWTVAIQCQNTLRDSLYRAQPGRTVCAGAPYRMRRDSEL
jgi:hypothetical protein